VCAAVKPVDIIDEMFIADVVSLEWEVLRWRDRTIILFEMFWQNEAKKLNIFWGLWGRVGSCLRSMRWIGANRRSEHAAFVSVTVRNLPKRLFDFARGHNT
jgi:hypothetical protein